MKPFVRIAFPGGQLYELPVTLIAENRAKAMQELHPSEFLAPGSALEDTVELFKEDASQATDWAQNNMNWDELEPHARLVRYTPPRLDHVNGCEWTYHDNRGIMAELSNDVGQMPVELVLNTMALQNQLCNVNVLHHEGNAFAALAMIIGSKPVIEMYIQALDYTTRMLQQPAEPVNVAVPASQLIH